VAANQELGGGLRTFYANTASQISALNDTVTTPVAGTYPSGTVFTLTNLFPFVNGYTFYSGGCTANDPSKAIANYYTTYPGKLILDPGASGGAIDVFEPSVTIKVQRNSTNQSNVPVWAYPTNTGCDGTRIFLGNTQSNGTIQYNGLPYGNYTLCAWQNSTTKKATATVSVNSTSGVTAPTLALPSGTQSKCGETAPGSTP
jgi:hypothetical protein